MEEVCKCKCTTRPIQMDDVEYIEAQDTHMTQEEVGKNTGCLKCKQKQALLDAATSRFDQIMHLTRDQEKAFKEILDQFEKLKKENVRLKRRNEKRRREDNNTTNNMIKPAIDDTAAEKSKYQTKFGENVNYSSQNHGNNNVLTEDIKTESKHTESSKKGRSTVNEKRADTNLDQNNLMDQEDEQECITADNRKSHKGVNQTFNDSTDVRKVASDNNEEINGVHESILKIADTNSAYFAASLAHRTVKYSVPESEKEKKIGIIAKSLLKAVLHCTNTKVIHETFIGEAIKEIETFRVSRAHSSSTMCNNNLHPMETKSRIEHAHEVAGLRSKVEESQDIQLKKKMERLSFVQAMHLPWWIKKEGLKKCTMIWLLKFVSLFCSWSKQNYTNGSEGDKLESSNCIISIIYATFTKELRDIILCTNCTSVRRSCNKAGAIISFLAGMCRVMKCDQLYDIILYSICKRWAIANNVNCAVISLAMELYYLTATSIWTTFVDSTSCLNSTSTSESMLWSNLHKILKCKRQGVDGGMFGQALASIEENLEILESIGGNQNSRSSTNRYSKIGQSLVVYCAVLGWESMHKKILKDRVIPMIVKQKSKRAFELIVIPLLDIAIEEEMLDLNSKPQYPERAEDLRQICDFIIDSAREKDIGLCETFKSQIWQLLNNF